MRTLIIVAALLFPLTSGIVSVITAGPAINEPVSALAHKPSATMVATRFDH